MHARVSPLSPQPAMAPSSNPKWLAEMAAEAQAAGRIDDALNFIDLTYAALDRAVAGINQAPPLSSRRSTPPICRT